MPYLPLDVDAKRKLEAIERGLCLPRHTMVGGAMDLYESVWRAKAEGKPPEVAAVVDELALGAAFGPDLRIREAMVSREFLEPVDRGWRVRGAAKWLFGLEGKSRGGKAAKGNLKRGSQPGALPGNPETSRPDSPAQPGPMPEDGSRQEARLLHPATQQPSNPSFSSAGNPQMDGVRAVGALDLPGIVEAAKADRRKAGRPMTGEPPDDAYKQLVADLFAAFRAERGSDPEPKPRDWKALKQLRERTKQGDREIVVRFGRGLRAQFKQRADNFWDLNEKWDALAGTDPPKQAGGARDVSRGMVRAQDVDASAFEKTGTVNGF